MEIIHDIDTAHIAGCCVQTIGGFDGLHLGHQYLLQQVKEAASSRNVKSMVVTFRHHPSATLRPEKEVKLLTTLEEKLTLLEKLDIDITAVLDFTPQPKYRSLYRLSALRHSPWHGGDAG